MARGERSLAADEEVVLRLRSHGKALVAPAFALILLGGAAGVGTALVPSGYRPVGQYLVVVAVGLLCVWWSLLPFLRWRARTYTVTTQRLRTRDGIVSRSGLSLPLLRVNDVSYQRSLVDRVFGCGTLVLQTAAEGALVLRDVPEVERVHLVLTDLVLAAGAGQRPDDAQLAEASAFSSAPARRLTRRARRQSDEVLSSGHPR